MGKYEYVDAFTTNNTIVETLYDLIDGDEDAVRANPEITVHTDPDDADVIDAVEYDSSGRIDWWSERESTFRETLEAFVSEVTIGWGRPLELLLQGGGPTHWIEAKLDSDGDVMSATLYATQEGPDHIDRKWELSKTSALYRLTESYAETNQMPQASNEY